MQLIDWLVVGFYMLLMLTLAALIGRGQRNTSDYYLGAKRMSALSLASSTIATQCSTNSLLGAPAFVGFTLGGGLLWLQYELAVPLAMLALIYLLTPIRRLGVISVYEFLERRLGPAARLVASGSFQIFRGVATGVTVYGVALVLTLIMEVTFTQAVLLMMGVTIAYDVLGGMRAVVFSDVVQLVLLTGAVVVSLCLLGLQVGGFAPFFDQRTDTLSDQWGLTGGSDYGFWPMLIGGFFLYAAYYGCDQSQAQRVLSARSESDTQRVLLYNGILRFPLVFGYCLLGLGLAAYAATDPAFVASLPLSESGMPNYNLAYPYYVLEHFAPGFVGLVMVGIFAAAMSSIDSSINSLSAATVEDFLHRFRRLSERQLFVASKLTTLFWGGFAVAFSYQVERIAPTVLEAINKIGSMVNGPLLALFTLALLAPKVGQTRAIVGFFVGVGGNFVLWQGFPGVSWLWWNVFGFITAIGVTALCAVPSFMRSTAGVSNSDASQNRPRLGFSLVRVAVPARLQGALLLMAVLIFLICLALDRITPA